jgi:hypothetical protein
LRQRAFIHVAGPALAGKTTFVEALLRGLDEIVICVRAIRDDNLRMPKESSPKTQTELRRYRYAGASAVALYRFPAGNADLDPFFMTDFMQDYSTAVVIEGDCPIEYVGLCVYVAPPLPTGEALLVRVQRDHSAKYAASLDAWGRALESPGVLERFITRGFGEPVLVAVLVDPAIFAQTRAKMKTALKKLRAAAPPKPTEHWAIAAGYGGIERAQLVVANARDEDEQRRADLLVNEVGRIRKDDAVFKDVLGLRGNKVPVMTVAANLMDPDDPGLKKAVARVARAIERVQ